MAFFDVFALHDDADSAFGLIRTRNLEVVALLKEIRLARGLSANQIRATLGLSQTDGTINSWFSGRFGMPLFFIRDFVRAFDCAQLEAASLRVQSIGTGVRNKYRQIRVPSFDVHFCYLLGALIGDGCLSKIRASYRITFELADESIVSRIRNSLFATLGIRGHVRNVLRRDGRRTFVLSSGNKCAYRLFTRIFGILPRKTLSVAVPVHVFSATPELKLAFLFGMFETDGSESRGSVRLYTSSRNLSEGLLILIKSLGFSPRVYMYSARQNPEFQISLNRADSKSLLDLFRLLEAALPRSELGANESSSPLLLLPSRDKH